MSRRGMLAQCANGFGAVALAALHADPAFTSDAVPQNTAKDCKEPQISAKYRKGIRKYRELL